jgi:hypothetical protein
MASTNTADSVNARRVVTSGPWPTIRPDRIGTIGSTQGVNASSRPKPKNTASTAGRAPPLISAARRSDSDTGPALAVAAEPPIRPRRRPRPRRDSRQRRERHRPRGRRIADAVLAHSPGSGPAAYPSRLAAAPRCARVVQDLDIAEKLVLDGPAGGELGRQRRAVRADGELLAVQVIARARSATRGPRRRRVSPRRSGTPRPAAGTPAAALPPRPTGETTTANGAGRGAGPRLAVRPQRPWPPRPPGLRRQADADVGAALGLDLQREAGPGRPAHGDADLEVAAVDVLSPKNSSS